LVRKLQVPVRQRSISLYGFNIAAPFERAPVRIEPLSEEDTSMFGLIDLRKHFIGVLIMLACIAWASNFGKVGHGYKVKEVDASGAEQLIAEGALVIDVRGQEQFNFRHIPGAILVTIEELRAGIPAKVLSEAKDRRIVVYCNRGLLHGPEGTEILNKAGFAGAVNLRAGIEGWADAGYPIQKS
jgi:rhodanese-related sulfurtransferase